MTDNEQILNSDIGDTEKDSIAMEYLKLLEDNKLVKEIFYKDLEIFDGIEDEDSIFDTVNLTQTTFGKLYLKHLLKNPTKDIEVLKSRQDILNKINSDLKKKITEILDEIKNQEKNLFWLLREKTPDEKKIIDSVYFSNKYLYFLNSNENVLTIFTYFKIIFAPVYGLISPLIFFIGPYLYLYYFSNIKIPIKTYIDLFKSTIFGGLNIFPGQSSLTKYISLFISFVIYIQNFFNSVKLAQNTNNIVNIFHTKIQNLNKFIKICNELHDLTKDVFKKLEYDKCESYDCMFDAEPLLISNKGKILITYKELEKFKDKCKKCFNYVGMVDAFTSTRSFINYLEDKNLEVCYTKFLKSDKPIIKFKKLWHPHLSKIKTDVVFNDISLGDNKKHNMLLTGPNAGGKSTFIKSISISLLFSQTLGISFSKTCHITPFSFINTYLNIPDIKGKESLFEAEMHRCKDYLELLENLDSNEFSFIVMDEIFSSTNPKEGIAGAYAICNKLSTFKNSISVITTHFSKLTDLEKTNETFTNYKIPISRNEDDEIIYPYKLMQGVSDQFIALELLKKKGFNQDIIDNAIKICKDN